MTRCALAALSLLIFAGLIALPAKADGLADGTPAPPIALFDTEGQYFDGSALLGHYVILNFWAFWCNTWKKEMPGLTELSDDQNSDNFKLIAVSVDGTRLPLYELDTAGMHISFPVLLDTNGRLSKLYNIHHVPTVVIIDSMGRIRYTAYGFPGPHVVLSALRKMKSAPAPSNASERAENTHGLLLQST